MQEIIYLNLQEISYGALNVEIVRVSERSPQIFNSDYHSNTANNNDHKMIQKDREYFQSILEEIKKRNL